MKPNSDENKNTDSSMHVVSKNQPRKQFEVMEFSISDFGSDSKDESKIYKTIPYRLALRITEFIPDLKIIKGFLGNKRKAYKEFRKKFILLFYGYFTRDRFRKCFRRTYSASLMERQSVYGGKLSHFPRNSNAISFTKYFDVESNSFTRFRSLRLISNVILNDAQSLAILLSLKTLRCALLQLRFNIGDNVIKIFNQSKELRKLRFGNSIVTPYVYDTTIDFDLPNIREMGTFICLNTPSCKMFTVADNYPQLRKIDLYEDQLHDEHIRFLRELRNLSCLKMSGCVFHGILFHKIFQIPKLEVIWVQATTINNSLVTDFPENEDYFVDSCLKEMHLDSWNITCEKFAKDLCGYVKNENKLKKLTVAFCDCVMSGSIWKMFHSVKKIRFDGSTPQL